MGEAKSPDASDAGKTTKIGVLAPMSITLFIALGGFRGHQGFRGPWIIPSTPAPTLAHDALGRPVEKKRLRSARLCLRAARRNLRTERLDLAPILLDLRRFCETASR